MARPGGAALLKPRRHTHLSPKLAGSGVRPPARRGSASRTSSALCSTQATQQPCQRTSTATGAHAKSRRPPCLARLRGRTRATVRSALRGGAAGRRRATKAAAASRRRRGAQSARHGVHHARLRAENARARSRHAARRSERGARPDSPREGRTRPMRDSRDAPRAVQARPRAAERRDAPAARLRPQSPELARLRAPGAGADHAQLRGVRAAAVCGPRGGAGARCAHVRSAQRRVSAFAAVLRRAAPLFGCQQGQSAGRLPQSALPGGGAAAGRPGRADVGGDGRPRRRAGTQPPRNARCALDSRIAACATAARPCAAWSATIC